MIAPTSCDWSRTPVGDPPNDRIMYQQIFAPLPLTAALFACSGVHPADPAADVRQEQGGADAQVGPALLIGALKGRLEYAALDERSVEALARLAAAK